MYIIPLCNLHFALLLYSSFSLIFHFIHLFIYLNSTDSRKCVIPVVCMKIGNGM